MKKLVLISVAMMFVAGMAFAKANVNADNAKAKANVATEQAKTDAKLMHPDYKNAKNEKAKADNYGQKRSTEVKARNEEKKNLKAKADDIQKDDRDLKAKAKVNREKVTGVNTEKGTK